MHKNPSIEKLFIEIETPFGRVRGKKCHDVFGNVYYSFQGLPYAKPPIGDLRFKAPQPIEPWGNKVYDATKAKPVSPAIYYEYDYKEISEDCLYLNIYTPIHATPTNQLPVMVNCHGGGFIYGSGHINVRGPNFLINKEVILVTFEYRLGVLGFLRFDDPTIEVPGNAGLKDMVMVLKWLEKNITAFGGNKDNITLFGNSAGGASIHLLMFSPLARGLFHKAILQSGTIFSPFVFVPRDDLLLGRILGFEGVLTPANVFEFLKQQTTEQLLYAQRRMFDEMKICGTDTKAYGPVIETVGYNNFLTQHPVVLLENGEFYKVPIIMGFVKEDGRSIVDGKLIPLDFTDPKLLVPRFIQNTVRYNSIIKTIGEEIQHLYYGTAKPSVHNKKNLIHLSTDVAFAYYIRYAIKKHCEHRPVYYYRFGFISNLNRTPNKLNHRDENLYIFNNNLDHKLNQTETKMIEIMTTMWTNFARTGNPNPIPIYGHVKWIPATVNNLHCLQIEWDDNFKLINDPQSKTIEQLEKIYENGINRKRPSLCTCSK